MEINYLKQEYISSCLLEISSLFIKFNQYGDIWIFNCFESCQHVLLIEKIKISQVKKIIIVDNSIYNISGLLGLLSSISLNTKTDKIDVFGPVGLRYYLFGGRKYSQTNFRYKLYIHELSRWLNFSQFHISFSIFYNFYLKSLRNYVVLSSERPGSLNNVKASNYGIPFGPFYGYLKLDKKLIVPDGFIFCNQEFVSGYFLGHKLIIVDKVFKEKYGDSMLW